MPQLPETIRKCEGVEVLRSRNVPLAEALARAGISPSSYDKWKQGQPARRMEQAQQWRERRTVAAERAVVSANETVGSRVQRLVNCLSLRRSVKEMRQYDSELSRQYPKVTKRDRPAHISDPDASHTTTADWVMTDIARCTTPNIKGVEAQRAYVKEVVESPEFAAAWPAAAAELNKKFPAIVDLEELPEVGNNADLEAAAIYYHEERNDLDFPYALALKNNVPSNVLNHELAHLIVSIETRAKGLQQGKDWTVHGAMFRGTMALLTDQTHGTKQGDIYRHLYSQPQQSVEYLAGRMAGMGAKDKDVVKFRKDWNEKIKSVRPLSYTNGLITAASDF